VAEGQLSQAQEGTGHAEWVRETPRCPGESLERPEDAAKERLGEIRNEEGGGRGQPAFSIARTIYRPARAG